MSYEVIRCSGNACRNIIAEGQGHKQLTIEPRKEKEHVLKIKCRKCGHMNFIIALPPSKQNVPYQERAGIRFK